MVRVLLLLIVLALYFCYTSGQSTCSPPDGGDGICKAIDQCPLVQEIIKITPKTQQGLDLLKKYHCGFANNRPKVCCPHICKTLDDQDGRCLNIRACPLLAKLLQPPLIEQNMQYVRDSKCESSQKYSVCCPLKAPTSVVDCAATASDLQPDPRSGCCGVDTVERNGTAPSKVGSRTTVNQYPWMMLIEYTRGNKTTIKCLGALISRRYGLTTAHCVVGQILDIGGKPTSVRLGEYDAKNEGADCAADKSGAVRCTDGMLRMGIQWSTPHPDYTEGRKTDNIAVLKLQQAAPFTEFIRPICLPSADVTIDPPKDLVFLAAGWGSRSPTEHFTKVKLQVDLPFVPMDECKEVYSTQLRYKNLTAGEICAGGVFGKDTCRGDTGGPLMYLNGNVFEATGITSFGPIPCALEGIPGMYTNVHYYLPWIVSTINIDVALGDN